ncbi:hypothetical protein DNC80_15495 [Flavobacterium sp. SOK18b]|uniref:hypothetical protein n=1 Tax=Flavobacterium sp. SOK18b TaxID=797900 RepID=UPI0015FABC50|nr:hypothetical protein [Flavobacterium sp. SOK18b]MBB1195069.1 hypothetical protein [Flavobacterium sp. SOK18b]
MKPTTKKSNNTMLYAGIALLVGVGAYAISGNKQDQSLTESEPTTPNGESPTTPISVAPKVPNYNLILRLGSRGQEVAKLQSMMGVPSDGIFGLQTESKLFELKGVKIVSLNTYAQIVKRATLSTIVYPAGTKVMVKNRNGAKVYRGERKADGTYFSTGDVAATFKFGEHIGTIKSVSADKQSHSVHFKSFLYGDLLFDAVGFINTVDVEKYT